MSTARTLTTQQSGCLGTQDEASHPTPGPYYSFDDADNITGVERTVGMGSPVPILSYTSDEDGNLLTRTDELSINKVVTGYVWDDFNRLVAVSTTDDSKKQTNVFGVNGFRRKKKDKNDVETTEYAAGLATAVAKSQAQTFTYLMGHQLLGFEKSDGSMFYFLSDALSTVRDVVDSDGGIVASYEFSEYGQRISSSESGASSEKTFVGGLSVQDEVADTGLMLMGHRFYEPEVGRFLNRDPIGFRGGLNLFEYAGSRPISRVDHTGLKPEHIADQAYGINHPSGAYIHPHPTGEDLWMALGFLPVVGSIVGIVDFLMAPGFLTGLGAFLGILPGGKVASGLTPQLFSKGFQAIENASKGLLNKVSKKRHLIVAKCGSDEYRYLQHMGAEGMTVGADMSTILVQSPAKKAVVLEEFLHGTQRRLGMVPSDLAIGVGGARSSAVVQQLEYHVKDFMVRHSRMLKLSPEDVEVLKKARDFYAP